MDTNPFEDMLRQTIDRVRDEERAKPRILPEAAIARLRELLPAYTTARAPYQVGDVVTPRRDSAMKQTGEPHLVVAVLDEPVYRFDHGEVSSNGFGQRLDMRVIHINGERVFAHWVESSDVVPYVEPTNG